VASADRAPFFFKVVAGTGAVFLVVVIVALALASIRHGPVPTTLGEHVATLEATEREALAELCARAGISVEQLKLVRVWQNEIGATPMGIVIGGGEVRALHLSETVLADAHNLAAFPELASLWLDKNQLRTLPSLASLRQLRELNVRANQLVELPELPAGLEVLDAGDNQLRAIDSLSRVSSLRQLFLGGNRIESVEPLAGLRVLAEVDLDRNRLTTIEPLLRVMTLRRVYVRGNPLTEPKPSPTMRNGFLEIYADVETSRKAQ
jgi:Leucine-rich repeat (LRR) protein